MLPTILAAVAALIVGIAAGFVIRKQLSAKSEIDLEAKQKEILLGAKDEALKIKEEAKKDEEEKRL